MDKIKQEIILIGRAMLALDFQNSHSGNISVRAGDEMYITKTGSMKGHLEERDICKPGLFKPEYGLFQASSETGEHRAVLQYAGAMIHGHALAVVLLSYIVDEIVPIDAFGRKFLQSVPVKEYEFPIGSKEMEEEIPIILKEKPVMVVKFHGPFVRGATLTEAFFNLNLVNHSAEILLQLDHLGIAPAKIVEPRFPDIRVCYSAEDVREVTDEVLFQQFRRIADDVFHLRLSPFHTGSLSVQDGREMLFAPAVSVPGDMPFAIRRLPINRESDDYFENLHRAVYRHSNAKAALFTLSPEAMVQSFRSLARGEDRIIPLDAEGGYLYPAVPVVTADEDPKQIIEKAVRYKMVAIAGLGVLAIGHTPGHTIHHNSSIKSICYFKTQLEMMQKIGRIADCDRYLCEKGKTW